MAQAAKVDKLLWRVSKACLAFPEATEEASGDHVTFRVRKKVCAYFLNNHHGDGIVELSYRLAAPKTLLSRMT